ncbi:MAG: NRDE family protein [Holophaga sp.]|nr:NRDE family protein [Holophaga sp.]
MCLILVAWQTHPEFPLVVAANRDEFYARPSAPAGPWPEDPRVQGGRDLEAGGTWLGLRADGRMAAVTNVREPGAPKGRLSRGMLTRDFLLGRQSPAEAAATLDGAAYSGFNLLLADDRSLWYGSNRDGAARELPPGVYGVSNHLLDTPWPKLVTAKARFTEALAGLPGFGPLFDLLADPEIVPDHNLPHSAVTLEWERMLSAIFVKSETYGTRASTVLTWRPGHGSALEERRFGPGGVPLGARFPA